jgi:hypothetical protein
MAQKRREIKIDGPLHQKGLKSLLMQVFFTGVPEGTLISKIDFIKDVWIPFHEVLPLDSRIGSTLE